MDQKLSNELALIKESIGDNTTDNLVDELSRAVGIELDLFVCDMLAKNVQQFIQDYHMPHYEDFRTAFKLCLKRYQVMSGDEEGDLFRKIENMFLNIFSSKYSHCGHEVSDVIAKKYAVQMIKFFKANKIQANADLNLDKTGSYY